MLITEKLFCIFSFQLGFVSEFPRHFGSADPEILLNTPCGEESLCEILTTYLECFAIFIKSRLHITPHTLHVHLSYKIIPPPHTPLHQISTFQEFSDFCARGSTNMVLCMSA